MICVIDRNGHNLFTTKPLNPMWAVVSTCVKPPHESTYAIAILGIWGDMLLTRGKYGITWVRGSYGAHTGLRDAFWKVDAAKMFKILPRNIRSFY